MKALVTGAAGMLGSAIIPAFAAAGWEVIATDLRTRAGISFLDVRNRDAIDDAIDPSFDLVLHLAAETDLETCERDPHHAHLTNVTGSRFVAMAAARYDIPLVYIGTAGIFDGRKQGPYVETDRPNPINVYGKTKWQGEQAVIRNHRHLVARAGWMIGGGPLDHKFVAKIRKQLDDGATKIYAVTDKLGTPTYTRDFAANLVELVDREVEGTVHMVCGGEASRYDVAKEICRLTGHADVEVVPVTSEYFAEEFSAPRPRSEAMSNAALDRAGLNRMRPWQEALAEYLGT